MPLLPNVNVGHWNSHPKNRLRKIKSLKIILPHAMSSPEPSEEVSLSTFSIEDAPCVPQDLTLIQVLEALTTKATTADYRRLEDWLCCQDIVELHPVSLCHPLSGRTCTDVLSWASIGRVLPRDSGPSPESSSSRHIVLPGPIHCFALENLENGYQQLIYLLAHMRVDGRLGWFLCWAIQERQFCTLYDWENSEDEDKSMDPSECWSHFVLTESNMSYCRLLGLNFFDWAGTVDSVRDEGFRAYYVVQRAGVLKIVGH
jgi:hypothetical protein